jgi:hypothetical protein
MRLGMNMGLALGCTASGVGQKKEVILPVIYRFVGLRQILPEF